MLESGYVRIYRSFLNWEWYDDANTMRVFLHLILTANWEPKKWHGITIERGQRVCSYGILAKELKISEKSVRTAINHLKQTGEVAHTSTRKYGVFTVFNYDSYQQVADQRADSGHPDPVNNLLTGVNPTKNGHTSGHTEGTDNSQAASQNLAFQKTDVALSRAYSGHTAGTQRALSGQQLKKDKESNKDKNDKKYIRADAFIAYAGEDAELLKALNDYAEMRKQKKKPLTTERAVRMLFSSLDKLAPDSKTKIAILNQSVFYNWTGVFPLKSENQTKQSKPEKQYTFDVDEYEKESLYDTEMKK